MAIPYFYILYLFIIAYPKKKVNLYFAEQKIGGAFAESGV